MLMDVNLNALLTAVTPTTRADAGAGAYSAVNYGIRPLGALVGGALGTTIGLRPTLVVAGLGGVLAVLWLLASPVRHIQTLDDQRPDVARGGSRVPVRSAAASGRRAVSWFPPAGSGPARWAGRTSASGRCPS